MDGLSTVTQFKAARDVEVCLPAASLGEDDSPHRGSDRCRHDGARSRLTPSSHNHTVAAGWPASCDKFTREQGTRATSFQGTNTHTPETPPRLPRPAPEMRVMCVVCVCPKIKTGKLHDSTRGGPPQLHGIAWLRSRSSQLTAQAFQRASPELAAGLGWAGGCPSPLRDTAQWGAAVWGDMANPATPWPAGQPDTCLPCVRWTSLLATRRGTGSRDSEFGSRGIHPSIRTVSKAKPKRECKE